MDRNAKTVIITGGNSGLGYSCAENIAKYSDDFHVLITCRNIQKAKSAVNSLKIATGNPNIYCMEMDLASLSSIRAFCNKLRSKSLPPLFAVVCNSGTGTGLADTEYTKDDFEFMFGVSHLGHFLLVNLLLPRMVDNGRVIFVTSNMHNPVPKFLFPSPRYNDATLLAHPVDEKYLKNNVLKYTTSKLCNIYCAYEMAERISEESGRKILVNAFAPGFIPTQMRKNSKRGLLRKVADFIAPLAARIKGTLSTVEESGKLLAMVAVSPKYEGMTGKYIDRARESRSSKLSYSKVNAKNLWERSFDLVKLDSKESIFNRRVQKIV